MILLSAVIAFFGLGSAHGHSGDRVYRFYEIPDEAAIDITDGSIEDWEELFGEPSLTSLDFTGFTSYQGNGDSMEYNPSDLAFRIYLGWNGASNPTRTVQQPEKQGENRCPFFASGIS